MQLGTEKRGAVFLAALLGLGVAAGPAAAQQIDLSHGGPVEVTAVQGIDWLQNEQEVVARGDARAVRDNVTVTADELIAHYRKKAQPAGAAPQPVQAAAHPAPGGSGIATDDTEGNEIYRLDAIGNVHIFTATDQAWGDKAVYDMDQAVLVMTGHALKVQTPQEIMTARDDMEYWSQRHMMVGRGNAVVVTNDGRRLAGDTLVGYTTDPNAPGQNASSQNANASGRPAPAARPAAAHTPASGAPADPLAVAGKLQRVEAFGNVQVRTATEIVYGDRGVYVPDTGIARLLGHVRITRGQNQVNGPAAIVNMKTGIATLISGPSERVHGLIMPNDAQAAASQPGGKAASGNNPPAGSPTGSMPAGPTGKMPAGGKP